MKTSNALPVRYDLSWSYFSSPNAERFGFGKTGCWTISRQRGVGYPKAVEAFPLGARDKAEIRINELRAGKAVAK